MLLAEPKGPDPSPAVLMTADTVGGVWSYALSLCRALPETRFVVATMGPRPRRAQRDEIRVLENATLVESDQSLEWMLQPSFDFRKSRDWLIHVIEAHDVDIVHVNGYAHARLGGPWPVLLVAHSDVLSWWQAVHKCAASPEWNDYRQRVAAGLAAATRIIAPTVAVLQDLEHHYGPLASDAQVIPNGSAFGHLRPVAKRPLVLGAGRLWDAAKNLAAMDEVAPRLLWPVEIAGDIAHPEGGFFQSRNVRLLGHLTVQEMTRHLGNASIFVAPALYEPFGLAILEAAAAGCALVLGDIPSLRENWDGAAEFVDPDDRSALAFAINALIGSAEWRDRLASAARDRARRFTLQRMAQSYDQIYHDLARNSARLETA